MVRYSKLTKIINRFYPAIVIAAIYTVYSTHLNLQQESLYYKTQGLDKYVGNASQAKGRAWKSIVWKGLWHGGLRMQARAVDMNKCEYKCTIDFIDNARHNQDYFPTADAIIFQGGRLPRTPPRRAHSKQVYVFTTIESPLHLSFSNGGKAWHNAMNWTMTYRVDSDILYKYGSFKPKTTSTMSKQELSEAFDNKTKDVAWLVSDCKTEGHREQYVQQLQKYIKVDVYGKCGNFKNCTKEEGFKCLETIGKDYKFYLSFENSMCKDYMTEKVFVWFQMNIVNVVRGAMNYDNLLPLHTYIDAHKFQSIQELGQFLKHLGQDKEEYIKYLLEKDKYETENMHSQFQRAYCELCKRLQDVDKYRNTYQSINQWWSQDTCKRVVTDIK